MNHHLKLLIKLLKNLQVDAKPFIKDIQNTVIVLEKNVILKKELREPEVDSQLIRLRYFFFMLFKLGIGVYQDFSLVTNSHNQKILKDFLKKTKLLDNIKDPVLLKFKDYLVKIFAIEPEPNARSKPNPIKR